MTETFKSGDTVQLKSGGPVMTAAHYQNNGELLCIWYEQKVGEYKKQLFWQNMLIKASDEPEVFVS